MARPGKRLATFIVWGFVALRVLYNIHINLFMVLGTSLSQNVPILLETIPDRGKGLTRVFATPSTRGGMAAKSY